MKERKEILNKDDLKTVGLAVGMMAGSVAISGCAGTERLDEVWNSVPPAIRDNIIGVGIGAAVGIAWEFYDGRSKVEGRKEQGEIVPVKEGSNILEYFASGFAGGIIGGSVESASRAFTELDAQRMQDILTVPVIYTLWRALKKTKNPIK
jgi:hypothetical protein